MHGASLCARPSATSAAAAAPSSSTSVNSCMHGQTECRTRTTDANTNAQNKCRSRKKGAGCVGAKSVYAAWEQSAPEPRGSRVRLSR
eukprot:6187264-Pleurochrysis_carterae.AAC.1